MGIHEVETWLLCAMKNPIDFIYTFTVPARQDLVGVKEPNIKHTLLACNVNCFTCG